MGKLDLARRYVGWLERRAIIVLMATAVVLAGSVYLVAFHLPLRADFSYLLPQDATAVKDLRKLEARTKVKDTALVIVIGQTPAQRIAAVADMTAGLRQISSTLIEQIHDDDKETRDYFRARKHLFVPLADLERGRDALRDRIERERVAANPLLNILGPEEPSPEDAAKAKADQAQLDELRQRQRDAEAKLDQSGHISPDGLVQRITVRTSIFKTQIDQGKQILAAIGRVRATVTAKYPGVQIGVAGGISVSVAEHDALVHGMVVSSLITALLVGLVLILYLRSATLLVLVSGTLVVATTISFGAAALTVGHLNAATAFLGAIIAGNGVNYGILLVARYLEERRDHDSREALAIAIRGTLRPTLVASLAASIAYGSLAATSFRGFADFAVIGAVGMVVCWIASYVLLPALILRFGLNTRIYRGDPFIGRILVRVFGFRRPAVVVGLSFVLTLGAGVIVYRYVAADPFEYDMKQLRSEGPQALDARKWMATSDKNFGRGLAGKTYVMADRAEQVPLIVAALRKVDEGVPTPQQTIGTVQSILDAIPPDQDKRLAVLAEIRTLLDEPLLDQIDDPKAREEIKSLRPPDDLRRIEDKDLPPELADMLTEQDGRVGLVIAIRPALTVDEWNGHDLIRFASAVRKLKLGDGETVTTSGANVIFADIIEVIRGDGPIVTGLATLGLIVMVLLAVGPNRRAAAVLIATGLGTAAMVAICALLDLKVTFLDFVALPITLGLGVDYAINIAHRQHQEDADPLEPLRMSGSAVLICSLTTIIGYGSLLASQNLAIRGFGKASLIGEVCCLVTALGLVPALISVGRTPLPGASATDRSGSPSPAP